MADFAARADWCCRYGLRGLEHSGYRNLNAWTPGLLVASATFMLPAWAASRCWSASCVALAHTRIGHLFLLNHIRGDDAGFARRKVLRRPLPDPVRSRPLPTFPPVSYCIILKTFSGPVALRFVSCFYADFLRPIGNICNLILGLVLGVPLR